MFFNEAESLGAQAEPAAEDADDDKIDVSGHKRAKRGRKPLDPALPRDVVRHELPEDERVCPHDDAALREIGAEASLQLDIDPQQVRVIRHERVKYACPCCEASMRLAARPAQVIPKGLFTEDAIAWIVISKFLDGLPLYRQAALLGRFGATDISRNTVAGSVVRVGHAMQPVVNPSGPQPENAMTPLRSVLRQVSRSGDAVEPRLWMTGVCVAGDLGCA